MGQSLFYSYTSGNGTLAQSEHAGLNGSTYNGSVVFDTTRHTIWANGGEYGNMRVGNPDTLDANLIKSGIKIRTYNGAYAYFYVNQYGQLSIYECCSITGFDVYNGSSKSTGSQIPVQAVSGGNYLDKFYIAYNGTHAASIKLTSNYSITTNSTANLYPSTSGTIVTNSLVNNYYDISASNIHNGTANQQLTMTLEITDDVGTVDTKTINVVKFMPVFYYTVADAAPTTTSGATQKTVTTQTITIPATTNTQYFWVMIAATPHYQVTMEQGGGVADWAAEYNGTNTSTVNGTSYYVYRSPRQNVGGAQCTLKFTSV